MGSQFISDPSFGTVLGHIYPIDQLKVGYWMDLIAAVSLGTGTTKTKLGGTQVVGTGADYTIPTAARCIVAVRPKVYGTTPTANQAVLATLKIESQDLGMKDYEVFANPLDSGLGTAEMQMVDKGKWWPLMQPCNGGEKMQFYGTAQIANTVAIYESVDLLLSDTWPEGFTGNGWMPYYGPIQSKIAGINSGGGPTATGTAAASIGTDGGITVSTPRKRIIDLVGVVLGTTPAASKPIGGYFFVNASELAINPQRWIAEPITGFLGTSTTGQQVHLSDTGPMNLALRAPSTLKANFALDLAITTAGNFEVGYVYVDFP
jgi:hypothetical protein